MGSLPLDLNRYSRSPLSLLGQLGQTPSFVPEEGQDDPNREDLADEYEAQAGYYPPTASPSATVAAGPRQKSAAELRANQDYDQLRAALGQAPHATAPKWWQSVAAGAAGFGAGWSNAAGRTKHPIDIAAMDEGILHPGYQQKLQEWHSRVAPLQQITGLDQSQVEMERRNRQLDTQEAWNKARAEAEHQRGVMWAARARAYDQGKLTGKVASTPEERAAIADKYNFPPDMKQYYIANSNLSGYGSTLANPGRNADGSFTLSPGAERFDASGKQIANNPKVVDEGVQASRALAQELQRQRLLENEQRMSGSIEKTKADAEDRVRREREQLVKPVLSKYVRSSESELYDIKDPVKKAAAMKALQAINQALAPRLQAAQDTYARAIRQGGGTADDYDIDPLTLKATPRKPK
jgi:hypothetical protein